MARPIRPARYTATKPPLGAQIDWSHPLASGLFAAWLLNEGGGVPREITAGGDAVTVNGAPTWDTGDPGPAMLFDGTDDALIGARTPPWHNTMPITFACRVRFDTLESATKPISVWSSASATRIVLGISSASSSGVRMFFGGVNAQTAAGFLTAGEWVTLVGTWDGIDTSRAYMSGREVASATGSPTAVNPDRGIILMGATAGQAASNFVAGKLAWAYAWQQRALTADEVRLLTAEPFALIVPPRRWWSGAGVTDAIGTVSAGSLSIAGQTVTGTADSLATVATGSHTVAGQAITADPGALGAVATGSHSVSGQTITSTADTLATIATGSHAITGQTVTGEAGSLATVAAGSHAVSGQDIAATTGATGGVATGSHAVSGQAVSGVGGALATIGTGSHAVSGQTVTGTEGGAPVTGTVDTGSLAVAGQAVTGLTGSLGTVATGSHAVDGQTVTGTEGPTPATGEIASGALAVSGQAITAQTGTLATVATGSHAVSGQAVTAASGTAATVSTGTLAAVGQIVAASVDELASLIVGTLAVSGQPIAASAETVATIATGSLFVDGQAVIGITHVAGDLSFRLDADRVLSYLVSGTAVLAFTPAADRVLTFHEGAE